MTNAHDEYDKFPGEPHDAAFRLAFRERELAEAFFRHHLPEKVVRHIDFSTLEPVPSSFVDERFRQSHADMAYKVLFKGKPAFLYILFEHQSTPVYRMSFRALCYMVNIWKDFEARHPDAKAFPVILPVVLYHGRRKWNSPVNFRDLLDGYGEDVAWCTPDFAYHLFDLGMVDDEHIAASGNMALAVVLHLFKHIFDEMFAEVFQGTAKLIVGIDDERMFTDILEWAMMYALNARNEDAGDIIDIAARRADSIGDEHMRRIIMTAAEQLRQQGKEVGLREVLLKQVKKRFGRISPILEKNLRQSRWEELDRFGESIFDFTSLEDIEKWWERHGGGNA